MSRFLRLADVKEKIGLSRATIYRFMECGTFPKPVRLGARAIGFLDSDIDAWIASRVELRDGGVSTQGAVEK